MRSLQAVCLGLLALALSPCKSFQGPRAMRTMGGARRAAMQPLRMDLGTTVQLAEEAAKGGFLSGVIDTMLENRIDGDIAGVLGGSIGVIGTLIFYEKRRVKMLERVLCPYCLGSGYLTCAVCHGAEALQVTPETRKALLGSAMVEGDECICPTCDGAGAVVCPNCKGEGLSMPGQLIRQMDIEQDEIDEILEQGSVAALQADTDMAMAKKKKKLLLRRAQRAKLRSLGEVTAE